MSAYLFSFNKRADMRTILSCFIIYLAFVSITAGLSQYKYHQGLYLIEENVSFKYQNHDQLYQIAQQAIGMMQDFKIYEKQESDHIFAAAQYLGSQDRAFTLEVYINKINSSSSQLSIHCRSELPLPQQDSKIKLIDTFINNLQIVVSRRQLNKLAHHLTLIRHKITLHLP